MRIDYHTHLFGPGQVGGRFLAAARAAWGPETNLVATPAEHAVVLDQVDRAIVVAFQAPEVDVNVPNDYIAAYATTHPEQVIGFASVSPHASDWREQLADAAQRLHLQGIKLAPFYQQFYPDDRRWFDLYRTIHRLGWPILWHQGTSFVPEGYLDASRPSLLDPIAREFPGMPMIVAHGGHPWLGETVALIRKNPRVYADVSALFTRSWQLYNFLAMVQEYRVAHKVLFGSDFPFFTPAQGVAALRKVNAVVEGTALPRIADTLIEEILYRDALADLGLT